MLFAPFLKSPSGKSPLEHLRRLCSLQSLHSSPQNTSSALNLPLFSFVCYKVPPFVVFLMMISATEKSAAQSRLPFPRPSPSITMRFLPGQQECYRPRKYTASLPSPAPASRPHLYCGSLVVSRYLLRSRVFSRASALQGFPRAISPAEPDYPYVLLLYVFAFLANPSGSDVDV